MLFSLQWYRVKSKGKKYREKVQGKSTGKKYRTKAQDRKYSINNTGGSCRYFTIKEWRTALFVSQVMREMKRKW
jgi:hypothetical protein